ncbi:MFS transporter [Clostridiaceae bacterium BL-3]|nr:MFS transporter [Clostridiaceae bacterium BL-3]
MKYNRNLLSYMLGRFISYTGTGIQQIALPLYILDVTHSGIMMGFFSAINLIPNIVALPFAGILGDRKNRKNVMMVSDYARGCFVIFLGYFAMRGSLNLAFLFTVQIFISIMDSIFNASSTAILPELVEEDKLMNGIAARGGIDAVSMIIGPALGGIIYGIFGIKVIFYLNGLSFIISGISCTLINYENKDRKSKALTFKSFFTENSEVLYFIKKNKALLQLFSLAMVTNFLVAPLLDIVLPYVMKKEIGFTSQQYGYLISFFTFGILIGNILIATYLVKFSRKFIMKNSLVLQTMILFMFPVAVFPITVNHLGGHSLKLFMLLTCIMFLGGFFNSGLNTPLNTNLQEIVPNKMRSRFFSILGVFGQGAIPLGSVIYGVLLDKFPYYYILIVVMSVVFAVTLVFMKRAVPEVYEP